MPLTHAVFASSAGNKHGKMMLKDRYRLVVGAVRKRVACVLDANQGVAVLDHT